MLFDDAIEVDWENPITRGLEFLAVPRGAVMFDLVTETYPSTVTNTFTPVTQARLDGKSIGLDAVPALRTAGTATNYEMAWPASSVLRGGNIFSTGTLLCLGGAHTQTDGQIVYAGGTTETVGSGNQPVLAIDSFKETGRGNIVRCGFVGGNPKTSSAQLLGNPFSNRLHLYGYGFRNNGTEGNFFGGQVVEAFSGAAAWTNNDAGSRRARLFTGGVTAAGKVAIIAMFGIWSREISKDEYKNIYVNPAILLRNADRSVFVVGGAITLNSLTMTPGTTTATAALSITR